MSMAMEPSADPVEQTLLPTRYGRLRTLGRPDDLIEQFLREYGEWAALETRFVAGAIGDGARVADIGAFVGTFGLGLISYGRPHSVCFVEANPVVVPALRDNVARNIAIPATVVEAAIIPAALRGQASASVEAQNAGSFSLETGPVADRFVADLVMRQLTLTELRAQHGPFDLIKLDVEGLENAILRDDIAAIAAAQADLWLECSDRPGSLDLCQTLLDAGLDVYYFAFPVYSSDNFNNSKQIIFPWAYEAGLWATRRGAPAVDASLFAAGCFLRRITATADLRQALWDTPRWAPRDWVDDSLPTVVARASHTILGDRFDTYFDPERVRAEPSWIEPLPIQMKRELEQAREELKQAKATARASEIMLYAEREWMESQCFRFATEAGQRQQTIAELQGASDALRQEKLLLAHRLNEIELSRLYLVMLALRNLAVRHPRLFRICRPMLVRIWRMLRRIRRLV